MSLERSILPLRARGQLVFPVAFEDWRPEAHDDDLAGLSGPSLTWSRKVDGRGSTVRIVALTGQPISSDAVLIARAQTVTGDSDTALAEAALRLDAIRFAEDLRLGRWFSHPTAGKPASTTLTLALLGGACELLLMSEGRDTEDGAFDDLRAVAARGRFEARASAPPRT